MGKASELLSRILTHGPSQNTVFLVLKEMQQEGRYSEVIQECLKALNAYPRDIPLMHLLAESYLQAGFIGLCEAELIKVTQEIEKMTSAYKLQARIYEQQERFEAAATSLKKYLALNPDDREALDLLDSILQQEARCLFEKSETVEPEGEPIDEIGSGGGELPEDVAETAAQEEEETLVELATPTLAELYFSQGQLLEAIETYEKWIHNHPDDQNAEQRLNHMKAQRDDREVPEPSKGDIARMKAEKSIQILEGWLARMQQKIQ